MASIAINELRGFLSYDAENGALTWAACVTARGVAGKTAGTMKKTGYVQVRIKGRSYSAHRVCWALHHGEWPRGVIDHINGNRSDNRIANLRDTTHVVNAQNTMEFAGYYFDKVCGKYRVRVAADGRRSHIGSYETEAEAQRAYAEAKRELHSEAMRARWP